MSPDPSLYPAIDALPPLRDVISEHNLRAEKSLGQNFLLDQNITDKIVRHCGDMEGQSAIEIGPGPGGLTRSLLRSTAKEVVAIEFDARAVGALQSLSEAADGRLKIVHGDALQADLRSLVPNAPRKIVANLPYNIATPLLIQWLKMIREDADSFSSMTLMFQKEVAQRIVAVPNTKAYGRLSVISQWLCEAKIIFDLPGAAFIPPPKVKSSIVHLRPRVFSETPPPFEVMEKILQEAFGQRRKMLRSSLKNYAAFFDAADISETDRAEDLKVEDFVRLAKVASL